MTTKQRTILIVDDTPCDRQVYRQYLQADQDYTYTVLEEQSAEEALALCRSQLIDGILLDFLLPDRNGLEFLKALQAQSQGNCPPVVMVDSQGNEAVAVKAIKLGADDYLVKRQVTPDGLRSAMHSAIENAKLRRQLQHSEERLRVALEAARMGTWNWNILTNEITWSANLERLFGFEEGGFDGRYETFVRLLHPDDAERVLLAIARAVNDGKPYEIEFRVVFSDGRVRWAESKGQVFYDETGRPVRMAGVDLDITARKQAEAALQQSEALFRGVFESDLIGILFWDTAGRITDANEAFCQMTGYSRAELQAGTVNYHEITPAEYQERDAHKFEVLQTTGTYEPIEKEYICKDGSRIPILLGCAFLPGYADRGVAFVLDIRERKRLEQERESLLAQTQAAREEAEVANRMKDEFLTVVSHELRSPLNAILGWSRLLQTRELDAATRERALSTIERNTQAQVQLIDDLLDISRMVRGSLRLEAVPVNLAAVVEMTIASLRLSAEAKHIHLLANIDLQVGQVLGDANRLQQIITNLLTNAIKFTPTGGRVEVSVQGDRASCWNAENYKGHSVQICVTDTGKGIAADFLPHVFDRFRQADSSTTRPKDGLGLGLAIVRHLVELHGGTVTATSDGEGKGATFTVTLPLLQDNIHAIATEEEPILATPIALLQGTHILVVDDELDTREFYKVVLEGQGAVVTIAASAQEAFDLFQQIKPNLLVSDIGMPGEDGYGLLQRIRRLETDQAQTIPVIAVTAYARSEDRDRISKAGFQEHLTKPVEPQILVTAIAQLLQR